jgi:hypothetical protein
MLERGVGRAHARHSIGRGSAGDAAVGDVIGPSAAEIGLVT